MMQTISEIKQLLAARGVRPRRRFGQNFLHDKNQLAKLVEAADVQPGELILEVGPGTGTLTETLVDCGANVIACEIDDELTAIVEERIGDHVTLIHGDCLDRARTLNPGIVDALGTQPFKLVANLPYEIASPLMCTLLIDHPTCQAMYVTIQKEVAERLSADPASKQYGPLTILVRTWAIVEHIATLKPASFWPPPKVTSAMVAVTPRRPREADIDPHAFARFITDLFSKRRKQLGTIFGRDRDWPDGISASQRPEVLSPEQLIELWKTIEYEAG